MTIDLASSSMKNSDFKQISSLNYLVAEEDHHVSVLCHVLEVLEIHVIKDNLNDKIFQKILHWMNFFIRL